MAAFTLAAEVSFAAGAFFAAAFTFFAAAFAFFAAEAFLSAAFAFFAAAAFLSAAFTLALLEAEDDTAFGRVVFFTGFDALLVFARALVAGLVFLMVLAMEISWG
jgi:hypothetical protein